MVSENGLKTIDLSGMYDLIKSFPGQAAEGVEIGEKTEIKFSLSRIRNIVVTGRLGALRSEEIF